MFEDLNMVQVGFDLWCIVFGYFLGSWFAGRRCSDAEETSLDTSAYSVGEYTANQAVGEG